MERLVGATVEQFGRLDVLVNNAGTGRLIPVEDSDSAAFLDTYVTNVFGPAAAIRTAWPVFKRRNAGTVINVSSWAARDPFPGFFIYASSKAALNSLTRSCVNDAAHEGFALRAFSICPGAVETGMLRSIIDTETLPADRCLTPDDVADLALACIRGDHDNHNGAAIYISRAKDGSVSIAGADSIPR